MRLLFALLVLANIGALMWGVWYRDAAGEQRKTARPDINATEMRLVDEPGVNPEPRTKPATPPLSRAEIAVQCFRMGPVASEKDIAVLARRLNELHIGHRQQEIEVRQKTGQRLYLSGFRTQKAAEKKRRQLVRQGVKDHALVREPDNTVSVSLGVFSRPESMRRRLQELKGKGINPKVESIFRTRVQRWLKTSPIEAGNQQRLEAVTKSVPGVRSVQVPCGEERPPAAPRPVI